MNKEGQPLNLNVQVRVKRTPEIERMVQKEYDDFWQRVNPKYLERDPVPYSLMKASEYIEMTLWAFASTFGDYFYQGSGIPTKLVCIEMLQ